MNRRDFLKKASIGAAVVVTTPAMVEAFQTVTPVAAAIKKPIVTYYMPEGIQSFGYMEMFQNTMTTSRHEVQWAGSRIDQAIEYKH